MVWLVVDFEGFGELLKVDLGYVRYDLEEGLW